MNPIAEARGYKQLIREGWSIRRIASYVGKTGSYIGDRLRLIDKLAPEIQNGTLSVSHPEQLSLIESKAKQRELARLIASHRLNVRQSEQIVSNTTPKCPKCGKFHRPANINRRTQIQRHSSY
jgi:ParB-like chromosome segregation protein Spo0J